MSTILIVILVLFLLGTGGLGIFSLQSVTPAGHVSVVANEIPRQMTELAQLALSGDFAGARKVQREFFALMEVNFVESNPMPVKAAMALMGLLEPVWRLPMVPPTAASHAKIEKVLESLGLLAERSVHAS